MEYKAGDKITLTVVGTDDEGDVEVKMGGEKPEKDDFYSDMRSSMGNEGGEA
jgi:hypothetical protein